MGKFKIVWADRGRPPKVAPDPAYPEGKDVDVSDGKQPACSTPLPYPTGHENIGTWFVSCLTCGLVVAVTAASRPDDPRSITLACKDRGGVPE